MSATATRGFPDRLYARFGWKVWLLVSLLGWFVALLLILLGVGNTQRLRPAPTDAFVAMSAWTVAVCLVSAGISLSSATRVCRPLVRPPANRTEAKAAWDAAMALPMHLIKVALIVGVGFTFPAVIIGFWYLYGLDVPLFLFILLGGTVISANAITAVVFAAPIMLRPILRDLQRHFVSVPVGRTISLRTRLIVLVPTFSVGAGIGAAEFSQRADSGIDATTIAAIAITAVLGLMTFTPVIAIFAHSLMTPLVDLLAATERIKKADYSEPIPGVWGDELGEIALSLNEAMRALAERQQMARDVRESRARLVAAGDASRKRIERNIHDGAQQRLVALTLDVRMLESMAPRLSEHELTAALQQIADGLKETLAELRDLARGLHPAILTTDGLGPALQQLATRAKVPVTIEAPSDRFPEQVETTAYFVAAEALANVAKYAQASAASVAATPRNGQLIIAITDDGIGGAHASPGSGLSGLADRIAAVGGHLTVDSPPGGGTTILAEVPMHGRPHA